MKKLLFLLFVMSVLLTCSLKGQSGFAGSPPAATPSECSPDPVYHFRGQMDMQITTLRKGKDSSSSTFLGYFGDSGKTMAMVKETNMGSRSFTMTSIINIRDSQIITLMDMGTAKFASCNFSNKMRSADTARDKKKALDFKNFKETGKTNMICGYLCKEYFMSDEDGSLSLWISEEPSLKGLSNQGFPAKTGGVEYPRGVKGITMELLRTEIKSESIFRMQVTKIDLNMVKDISTEGYSLR